MISVIIPVYNISEYLSRCLDSVINQTYQNLEIILVNDGSTDSTGSICDAYASIDARIKVIHKKNGGVSSARNAGLEIAKGKYIGFVDGDDAIEPKMYEILVNNLVETNCDISCCKMVTTDVNGCIQNTEYADNSLFTSEYIIENYFLNEFIKDIMYSQCNKIFKREILKDIRYKNYKYGEDILFIFETLMKSKTVYYDNYVGYYYIHRENSAMTSTFNENRLDYINAIRKIEEYCEKYYDNALENARIWIYQHILTICRQIILDNNREKYDCFIKEYKLYLKKYKKKYLYKLKIRKWLDYFGIMYCNSYFKFLKFIKNNI